MHCESLIRHSTETHAHVVYIRSCAWSHTAGTPRRGYGVCLGEVMGGGGLGTVTNRNVNAKPLRPSLEHAKHTCTACMHKNMQPSMFHVWLESHENRLCSGGRHNLGKRIVSDMSCGWAFPCPILCEARTGGQAVAPVHQAVSELLRIPYCRSI